MISALFKENGKRILNRNKLDWETLNTSKIKTVFYSEHEDYGTKLRIKCHPRIKRNEKTIDGELCMNWELIDSFGVALDFDGSIRQTDGYEKFYDDPNSRQFHAPGTRL